MEIELIDGCEQRREIISLQELEGLCSDRLEDARILYTAGRCDGAFYLLGYVIEIALKRKICVTLSWEGYPNSRREFENFTSFKTHNLNNLLRLSGVEKKIKEELLWAWSAFTGWSPEVRYLSRRQTIQEVGRAFEAAEALLREL